jgi:hypothetical protein
VPVLSNSSNYQHRVKENDFLENHEDVQEYRSKYCDKYAIEPGLMKSALAKPVVCPGYALNEILKGRLRHMVHVDCITCDLNKREISEHAEFSYLINLPAKRLWVLDKEKRNEHGTWVSVPLLNNKEWSILSRFKIFDDDKAAKTEGLVERGPEYMDR